MSELRPMRWWDIETVAALERLLFPDDAWTVEAFWSELAQGAARHYLVAVEDERIVGYAGLGSAGSDADVETLAVAPGHQRRGLGRLLLDALVDEAWRRGCTAVLLEVRADNPGAQELYRRAGFEQISVRRGYYRPGPVDALVLRLRQAAAVPS